MKKILTLILLTGIVCSVTGQAADFTYQSLDNGYCTPSKIKFTQNATGVPIGYVWNFGNNNGSNLANPVFTYAAPGSYIVKLIVIYKKSYLQVSKTITIHPTVSGRFDYDRRLLCKPGVINFTAAEVNNVSSYQWDFGEANGIISTTVPTISYSFSDYQQYPVSLKVISNTGCSGQAFSSIIVERPVISGTVTPLSGCSPANANFTASVVLPPAATISSYSWDYADGSSSATTTVPTSNHIYSDTGRFLPRLHIVTNEGCTNDFDFNSIAFGTPPTNHIAYAKKIVFCGSESPFFVSKATNANAYFWNFDDGDTTTVTDTIVQHKFRTLGIKTITATPLFNNCPGIPISFTINVIGVIAGFDFLNTCSVKKSFVFSNTSQGNQSTISWDFGDGTAILNTINTVHTFPDTGTFNTSLRVTDNITGCEDIYRKNIYTAFPRLTNQDSSVCKNSITKFSIPENYNNPQAIYTWNVAGMPPVQNIIAPFDIQAAILGRFNNNFVIINNGPQYCPDTISLKNDFVVRGPMLDFNADANLCQDKYYHSTNLSYAFFPEDIINNWKWSYGITGDKDSVFQPQPYQFPYWGTFNVKLSATDINGCSDTLVKPVTIYDIPFLKTIPDSDTICAGKTIKLIAFHNDPIIWSPANSISCSNCDSVFVNPSRTTTYKVTATSRNNCSITDSIKIYVYEPFTVSADKTNFSICMNESVKFNVSPKNKIISWTPTSGLSIVNNFEPVAYPRQNSIYTATLKDSVGCFSSSIDMNVIVKSLPSVNAGPDKIFPYNTGFTLAPVYSSNIRSYNWSPAGLVDCSTCPVINAVSNTVQSYLITVTSDSGCVATDKVTIFVECNAATLFLPTAFSPNGDNLNDYYYPITRGIQRINRFAIYNRQGQLVFDARDFSPNTRSKGWDGKIKGLPQNASAYIYTLEAICDQGNTLTKKGSFVLIR